MLLKVLCRLERSTFTPVLRSQLRGVIAAGGNRYADRNDASSVLVAPPEPPRLPLWTYFKKTAISNEELQAVVLPGKERIRASRLLKDPSKLMSYEQASCNTAYEALHRGMEISGDGECLGTRSNVTGQYEWIPYSKVIERSRHLGSAMLEIGLKPANSTFVGINSKNRAEFVITAMACSSYSMVFVPLFDSYGQDALVYIINLANLSFVLCDIESKAFKLIERKNEIPVLNTIVVMDPVTPELIEAAKKVDVKVYQYDEFEKLGRENERPPVPPKPDDIFAVFFTSGTTGKPKGAMQTHANAMAIVAGLKETHTYYYHLCSKEEVPRSTVFSYLPAAHLLEVLCEVGHLYEGGRIGFYSGDLTKLIDDVQALKPTYFLMVPRVMNRIYQKVMTEVNARPLVKYLLEKAMKSKEKKLKKGIITKNSFWDYLLLRRIQRVLGGNVQAIFTSSAPVSKHVMRFFRTTMGAYVFECYGQTEIGSATITVPFDTALGNVGIPVPTCYVKLVDVPEMNYYAKDDVGEICIKGPTVFKGYLKNPEATKQSFDEDGWHHTGDIGRWLPNGSLQIIDRKKHLLKTSQGEYIAPEKIESVYSQSTIIFQIFVDGFTDKDFVVAIAVPDPQEFLPWLKHKGIAMDSIKDACESKEVRKVVLDHLHWLGNRHGLNSLEQVKAIYLRTDPFTIEEGLITPTQKLKREPARKMFHDVLVKLYEEASST